MSEDFSRRHFIDNEMIPTNFETDSLLEFSDAALSLVDSVKFIRDPDALARVQSLLITLDESGLIKALSLDGFREEFEEVCSLHLKGFDL